MSHPINVFSEIGKLEAVLLKRPGREIENLVPDYLERLLFDDIPALSVAQREHDAFADVLRKQGAEVLYLEALTVEALDTNPVLRAQFVDEILQESGHTVGGYEVFIREYLLSLSTKDLVDTIMSGLRKNEIEAPGTKGLQDLMDRRYPFYLDPMPNLYFTRDPAASIGHGMTLNRMANEARRRESLFMAYILRYHPRFAGHEVPVWLDRNQNYWMEGGDELVLARGTIAVGVSQRTSAPAIENLARNLFSRQKDIKQILAFEIPETRAFMHLDTVFTQVNYNQFTIHPAIQNEAGGLNIYSIMADPNSPRGLKFTHSDDLEGMLKSALGVDDLDLIPCGGGDPLVAAREQWNDGSNTLAVAPGVVCTYDRNYASNEAMREHGLEVHEIIGSELARGRGGPRCMSQPILRADID
ncbi:MAG: arginine deiminase [Actinomycetes bacterium]|jgi:arginine deiminase|nr:arginine deiminase [Actinomycetes bacterium]